MKVVGLGDSLTYGYAVPSGEGWFDRMSDYFPALNWVNCGIPGDSTQGMLYRFERDVVQQKADVVTILGGVNDLMNQASVGSVADRLSRMGELAVEHEIIPVLLLPLTVSLYPGFAGWVSPKQAQLLHQQIVDLRQQIQITVLKHKWFSFDLMSVAPDSAFLEECFLEDGIHVSSWLHKLISQGLKDSEFKDILLLP